MKAYSVEGCTADDDFCLSLCLLGEQGARIAVGAQKLGELAYLAWVHLVEEGMATQLLRKEH